MNSIEKYLNICTSVINNPNIKVIYNEATIIIYNSEYKEEYYCKVLDNIVTENNLKLLFYYKNIYKHQNCKLLFLTHNLNSNLINEIIQNNIEFIDTSGNMYLNNILLHIKVKGQKKVNAFNDKFKINDNSLKLIYVLLKYPDILKDSIKNISNFVRLNYEIVRNNLEKLTTLEYLIKINNKFVINNYIGLLELWQIEYYSKQRHLLFRGEYCCVFSDDIPIINEKIIEYSKNKEYLIGGELGVNILLGKDIKNCNSVIYYNNYASYKKIATELKLKPNSNGNIYFINNPYNYPTWNTYKYYIADPILLYSELIITNYDNIELIDEFCNMYINEIVI